MEVKHLDHLNLSVGNFEESAAWYGRVFGFKIVEQGVYRDAPWGVLKSGDAMLCIYEDQGRKHLDGDELRKGHVHGVNHFAFKIDDRAAWEAALKRENIEVFFGGAYQWPHSTSWYIRDPTGYDIEVVSWNGEEPRFG